MCLCVSNSGQWYGSYYITRTLVKKDDDYCSSYNVYLVEER